MKEESIVSAINIYENKFHLKVTESDKPVLQSGFFDRGKRKIAVGHSGCESNGDEKWDDRQSDNGSQAKETDFGYFSERKIKSC